MLYNGSDVIRDVEWVIFDEVHYISDSEVRKFSVESFCIATWMLRLRAEAHCSNMHSRLNWAKLE